VPLAIKSIDTLTAQRRFAGHFHRVNEQNFNLTCDHELLTLSLLDASAEPATMRLAGGARRRWRDLSETDGHIEYRQGIGRTFRTTLCAAINRR
jgi:hypothetical protein